MKITRDELVKRLECIKGGLYRTTIAGRRSCCHFNQEHGRACLFNGEVLTQVDIPGLDFTGSVMASFFFDFIEKFEPDTEFEMSVNDEGTALLFNAEKENTRAKIPLMSHSDFPINEVPKDGKWINLPPDFVEAMSGALSSCSMDVTKAILHCVHVKDDIVEGCDNFRFTRYYLSKGLGVELILPYYPVLNLCSHFKPVRMFVEGTWAVFENELGARYNMRNFSGVYPNLDPFLIPKNNGEEIVLPAGFKKAAERIAVYANTLVSAWTLYLYDQYIVITLKKGVMELKGEIWSGYDVVTTLPMDYNGEKKSFLASPTFFKDIANKTPRFRLYNNRAQFNDEEGRWVHVMMLNTDVDDKGENGR